LHRAGRVVRTDRVRLLFFQRFFCLSAIKKPPNIPGDCKMDEQEEFSAYTAPSHDNLETMSAMERETFADSMRDEWDQDCYLAA
jgi:hypothetical protein